MASCGRLCKLTGLDNSAKAPDALPSDDVTESSFVTSSDADNVTRPAAYGSSLTQIEQVGYLYMIPVICILGVILNSLVVLVLTRRTFRSPTYTFLSWLALADIVTALFTLPGSLARCDGCPGLVRSRGWLVYEVFVFVPITNISECISSWMTTVLAAERLLAIRLPMLDKRPDGGKQRSFIIVGVVVAGAVCLNMPYFFVLNVNDNVTTSLTDFGASVGFNIFSWIRASLVQFMPLVLLIFLNIFLAREIHLSRERCRRMCITSKSAAREQAQLRLTLMLTGTIAMFVAGHIPVALAYSVIFAAMFGEDSLTSDFYSEWLVVTHALALLSYALDFVVYCLVNKYFREACALLLSCDRSKRKISDLPSNSTSERKIPLSDSPDEKY